MIVETEHQLIEPVLHADPVQEVLHTIPAAQYEAAQYEAAEYEAAEYQAAEPAPEAASAQEVLRTMAAIVRTVFGVALQAPAAEQPDQADQAAAAHDPAPIASAPVDVPPIVIPSVQVAPARTLYVVPSVQFAPDASEPIPLEDTSATPPMAAPVQPPAEIPVPVAPALATIPVPAYPAPDSPAMPSERHSLALLQEIAFLDD